VGEYHVIIEAGFQLRGTHGMSEQSTLNSTPQTEEEYRAAVDEILAEIWRLNEQMKVDRAERERVRAETELLKEQTRRVFADMGLEL
jgi:hypothetical protein